MKKRIVFVADSNSKIGMGHVMRSLALANMLKQHFNVIFVSRQSNNILKDLLKKNSIKVKCIPNKEGIHFSELAKILHKKDIVIIDGYKFDQNFLNSIKKEVAGLVVIDDIKKWHYNANIIINPAQGISKSHYSCERSTKVVSGFKYALLSSAFLNNTRVKKSKEKRKTISISMGGADEFNYSLKVLNSIKKLSEIDRINIFIGSVNKHYKKNNNYIKKHKLSHKVKLFQGLNQTDYVMILGESDVVICPASTTAIEAGSLRVGLCVCLSADNQRDIYNGFIKKKMAIGLGPIDKLSDEQIKHSVKTLLNSPKLLSNQTRAQKTNIDKKSPERYLKLFQSLM